MIYNTSYLLTLEIPWNIIGFLFPKSTYMFFMQHLIHTYILNAQQDKEYVLRAYQLQIMPVSHFNKFIFSNHT
jgi:hypothetical protein